MEIFFIFLFLLILYLLFIVIINRAKISNEKISILNKAKNAPNSLSNKISITVWNIGYAGLGENSDFVTDGGKSHFAPSSNEVKENLKAIKTTLLELNSDIYLLQEVSDKSPLSFWVSVRSSILKIFPSYLALFRADIASIGLPWPFRVNHGVLTLANAKNISTNVITLPHEPTLIAGLLHRRYGLLVSRFSIKNSSKQWVIVNLHLAAFDENGATRQKQFDTVFDFAKSEYKKGNYVVLGGDWNMELHKTNFPHTTAEKYLFWKIPFPKQRLPKDWQISIDKKIPTVRSNHKPYIKGENYTAIIDGFIVSPNVKTKAANTLDINFKHTDHQPVSTSFSTK